MPFRHKAAHYKPPEPSNPFRFSTDKAYADILQDKMRETRWWRLVVGLGVLVLSAVNLCFFVYAVSMQKTVPVLINVMPTGEAQYVGEVRHQGALAVPESAILFQVREFITLTRSVSTDRAVVYANIEKCYDLITTSFEPVFTRQLRAASPFDLVGKARRIAEIESALRVTERSYQIDWLETTIETSGSRKTLRKRALVTIKLLVPTDETVRKNPLGIYIENCETTELAQN